jgi:hypothetical protein
MTRLRHSAAGYRRLLQLSSASLFVLVEGGSDVYFYSRLVANARPGVSFEVRAAHELPGNTGGKRALLEHFEYLRRTNSLCSTLGGKRTAVLVYVDKDVDDVLRTRKRSPHLVYTDLYETENYLYTYGDVENALAAVLGMTSVAVSGALPANWRHTARTAWREWIVACLATRIVNVNAEVNFGVPSRVNQPCTNTTDMAVLNARLDAVREAWGVNPKVFAELIGKITRLVDERFRRNAHDTIFRGKWYPVFLRHWLTGVATRTWRDNELEAVLAATIDYHAAWARVLGRRSVEIARRCRLRRAA